MNHTLKKALLVAIAALSAPALADDVSATEEKPGLNSPGDVSPPVAQAMVDDVNVGASVDAEGRVPAGALDDFLPGEDIYLTMDVSDAAPGTTIKVVWFGPGDRRLAEQHQRVTNGSKILRFIQDDTDNWKPGDYRAEVWVGDEKVNDEIFDVVAARSARN